MHAREQAVAERETRAGAREQRSSEQSIALNERESALDLRDRALCAVAEADAARRERERLMLQMREANERLVIATVRAEELVERAIAAHALAAQSATIEAERRRRAEASVRAKDEFVAMLGHELRNPLAPIMLALDLIALDADDAHKREHTVIRRQVRQLSALVDDLLDVVRIRSGKIELRRSSVEAADVVARATEVAAPLIESRRHTLAVHVPARGLAIDGDVARLTQVFANLLTNAAKYTPPGGSITVAAERKDAMVVVRVRDAGIGISPDMLPRIFDLFAQEQQPTVGAPGGLGLGLTIVRSFVEMHGGRISAHSEGLGRGSEFVVELPASKLS